MWAWALLLSQPTFVHMAILPGKQCVNLALCQRQNWGAQEAFWMLFAVLELALRLSRDPGPHIHIGCKLRVPRSALLSCRLMTVLQIQTANYVI